MKFIIFVIDDQLEKASNNEMEAINAFNDKLQDAGHWITAAGINHGEAATVLDNRGDAGVVIPGSLYNEEEHYSGFWFVSAPDKETAKRLALAGSKACNRKVELRPLIG